jgi:hypothetical protein
MPRLSTPATDTWCITQYALQILNRTCEHSRIIMRMTKHAITRPTYHAAHNPRLMIVVYV